MSSKEIRAWAAYWATLIIGAAMVASILSGCGGSSDTLIQDKTLDYSQTATFERDYAVTLDVNFEDSGPVAAPEPNDTAWTVKSEDGQLTLTYSKEGTKKPKLDYSFKSKIPVKDTLHVKDTLTVRGQVHYTDTTTTNKTEYPFMSKMGWLLTGMGVLVVGVIVFSLIKKFKFL